MEPVVLNSPSIVTRKPDKRSGIVTQSLRFLTMALPCLNYFHGLFYKDKVKIVPKNLGELLTARGLAHFIMDDGGLSVYNQTILHTRAFKLEDVKHIQFVLLEKFGLTTSPLGLVPQQGWKKKNMYMFFFFFYPAGDKVRRKEKRSVSNLHTCKTKKLKDIVGPFIHENMLYKIK